MIDAVGSEAARVPAFWRAVSGRRNGFPAGPRYWTPFGMTAAFRPDPLGFYMAAFRTFGDVVWVSHRPVPLAPRRAPRPHQARPAGQQPQLRKRSRGREAEDPDRRRAFHQSRRVLAPAATHGAARVPSAAARRVRRNHDRRHARNARPLGRGQAQRSAAQRGCGDEPPNPRYRRPHALQSQSRRRRRRGRPLARRGSGADERPHDAFSAVTAVVAEPGQQATAARHPHPRPRRVRHHRGPPPHGRGA